jgi:hypothetical protein
MYNVCVRERIVSILPISHQITPIDGDRLQNLDLLTDFMQIAFYFTLSSYDSSKKSDITQFYGDFGQFDQFLRRGMLAQSTGVASAASLFAFTSALACYKRKAPPLQIQENEPRKMQDRGLQEKGRHRIQVFTLVPLIATV